MVWVDRTDYGVRYRSRSRGVTKDSCGAREYDLVEYVTLPVAPGLLRQVDVRDCLTDPRAATETGAQPDLH